MLMAPFVLNTWPVGNSSGRVWDMYMDVIMTIFMLVHIYTSIMIYTCSWYLIFVVAIDSILTSPVRYAGTVLYWSVCTRVHNCNSYSLSTTLYTLLEPDLEHDLCVQVELAGLPLWLR